MDKHNLTPLTHDRRSPLINEFQPSDIIFRVEQRHIGDFNAAELEHAKAIKTNSINFNRLKLNPACYETINVDGPPKALAHITPKTASKA